MFLKMQIRARATKDESSFTAAWVRARGLSRRMAQQASLKGQREAQALAVMRKLNHVTQQHLPTSQSKSR